jgi:dynein regulatry complex protein 1
LGKILRTPLKAVRGVFAAQIDEMQAKDAEDFNKLKIRLETDIQVLQQQLQHMQATYLLNTEKLDYNFRVLTEKCERWFVVCKLAGRRLMSRL